MRKIMALIGIALLAIPLVSAEFTVSDLELTIYRDGYVKVYYQIIPSEYAVQISIPLLGKDYENLIVEDENGNPLNFEVSGNSVIIYVNDAQLIKVSYYTPDLTSKHGLVWTLNVSSPYPFKVVLPENAIVVDLSDIPLSISSNVISMPPGNQSISYTLEYDVERNSQNVVYYLLAGVLAISAVFIGIKLISRKKVSKDVKVDKEAFLKKIEKFDLNDEERNALLYILEKGGRASQAEVRNALGLPKTTAWRMFKRLEKQGLVKIIRGRKENWVELRP
ncbi:winged helix-turn-helix transcriptional regulator [Thermococcus sp. M39]|nr:MULTISPECIES: winged helix-turn-helix transcriptional regulator [unclassified Thermococcus]NJE07602.1 winged helix-turn-helix transcriptional regulator [Thermococcus sp. M39]NJE12186.1 winged helix-turn-helix transcriptional regulator [Thermococcus sp. LS2]